MSCQSLWKGVLPASGALPCEAYVTSSTLSGPGQPLFAILSPGSDAPQCVQKFLLFGTHQQCHRAGSSPCTRTPPCHRICRACALRVHPWLQGCNALTDAGLATLADMTSLTSVNLQDCRQVTGAASA